MGKPGSRSLRRPTDPATGGALVSAPALGASFEELCERAMESPEGHTGRMIAVSFGDGDTGMAIHSAFAATEAHSHDFGDDAVDFSALAGADALTFDNLGIAILGGAAAAAAQETMTRGGEEMSVATDRGFVLVPETLEWAQTDAASYLRGFRAAADRIATDLADMGSPERPDSGYDPEDEAAAAAHTWGLLATRVPASPFTGRGIRVAILDTGLDFGHPDFAGRAILAQSFVPGQTPQDVHGHGTHVAGTACGPRSPAAGGARYGVAFESSILIAKVLGDSGSGTTAGILAGINWALQNGAQVINMSLGNRGQGPAPHYTHAGQTALARGSLIVAAAGNNNEPTGQPANSPTILSVSSLTSTLQKSNFSNFGKVDLAAPGSSIDSALPRPRRRGFLSGTSMACPHVAGIAALYAQGRGLRGGALWAHLRATARRLQMPVQHQGAGLVQA